MLYKKTMKELASLLEKKETSSVEITKALLERVSSVNDKVNAFITVDEENALLEASASDERRKNGDSLSMYDGIPFALKDNISTKGLLTTCASGILKNYIPPFDATSYRKLKDAGFVTLGKTNMDEFAMGSTSETSFFGPVKNPHNTDCVPGGSSGGSAASVASGMVPAALGSDTGGSIRQPASFCGVVGIKPTYGRVSRFGLVAYASSLDQIGTFGRCVDDAAAMLGMISGKDTMDSTSSEGEADFTPDKLSMDIKGMKIGIPEEYFNGVNAEIKASIEKKVADLEKLGAVIEKISLKMVDYAIPVYYMIATAEASSNLARFDGVKYGYRSPNISKLSELYEHTRSEGFGAEVKRRIILGTFALSSGYYDAYYLKALKGRTLIIDDFTKAFEKVDAIVCPTTTSTAFKIGEKMNDPLEMYLSDILTISANLAAIPGLSVPIGKDKSGLPIGMQIMGGHFKEKTILSLAKAVESISEKIDIPI